MTVSVRTRVDFKPGPVLAKLAATTGRRMVLAEAHIRRHYLRHTGRPYPPASRPGTYPKRRTGTLQRGFRSNINRTHDGVRMTATNVAVSPRGAPYPRFLETGTSKMAARPHMSKVLAGTWRAVLRILARGR